MKTSKWIISAALAAGLVGASSANAAILLNEVFINPQGSPDNDREYIELRSTDPTTDNAWLATHNLYLINIEGDATTTPGRGGIDWVKNLNGLTFGTNGLMILGQTFASSVPAWSPAVPAATTRYNWGPAGAVVIENGGVNLLLSTVFTGSITNDTDASGANDDDIDTNNDNVIDNPLWTTADVIDSIGWRDGNLTDGIYVPSGSLPLYAAPNGTSNYDFIARFPNVLTANYTPAWFGGDLVGSNLSTTADTDDAGGHANAKVGGTNFPYLSNGYTNNGLLTPGAPNSPAQIGLEVPEPASLTLLGLGGLLMVRRRTTTR
ncbi:MAG: PEP-CTERM sorting domain-containing protein [Planctomycetes bacterium]|nr:PEP-CTERM sorting domain-containing protein [Planctomycetota bacterium]